MDEKQSDGPIELEMTADRYAAHDLGSFGCNCQIKGGRTWYESGWFAPSGDVILARLSQDGEGERWFLGLTQVKRRIDAETLLWVRMTPTGIEALKMSGYFDAIADQAAQTIDK